MNTPEQQSATRQTAVNGLAVTGFVALIALGMWLAVYSARFVPSVVGRLSVAAVSLSEFFTPAKPTSLSVVPTTASTTISFGDATSTAATTTAATHTTTTPTKTAVAPVPTAGEKTATTYQIGGKASSPTLSGLSDLIVTIDAIGYLQSTSTDSFIATSTVPNGKLPAVKFTIKNVGTNSTGGTWRFSASIPAQTAYIYQSQPQQALNPGDSIQYTLGFDQATKGAGELISVTANFDHAVAESNANNNSASASVTIIGS